MEQTLPHILPTAPEKTQRLIDLLANPNLTTTEIDLEMGFKSGETRGLIRRYPALAKKAQEARLLAFRLEGIEAPRRAAYKAIKEALEATKSVPCGSDGKSVIYENVPDHKIRLEAAQKILRVLGDDTIPDVNVEVNNYNAEVITQIEAYKNMSVDELMAQLDRIKGIKSNRPTPVLIPQPIADTADTTDADIKPANDNDF